MAGVIWLGMVAHGGAGTYQASRGTRQARQMAEQPDLVKALLGGEQETALQQLLEKFLAAEGGHCGPPRMDGQMDRPEKGGTQRRLAGMSMGQMMLKGWI